MTTLTKTDLIAHIATEAGVSKAEAGKLADAALSFFTNAFKAGDHIQMRGSFAISVKETAAREGRNPRTGEAIQIPAGRKFTIKVSKELLEG